MKTSGIVLLILFLSYEVTQAQQITLTFLAKDKDSQLFTPLEGVLIHNSTLICDTIVFGETPTILIYNTLGIQNQENPVSESFMFLQPKPNPFTQSTTIDLIVKNQGKYLLSLSDLQGNQLLASSYDLSAGKHAFEIIASVKGVLLFSVTNHDKIISVKLLSNSQGDYANEIIYCGSQNRVLKNSLDNKGFRFELGNQLVFKSIKADFEEDIIVDSPTENASYTFQLTSAVLLPIVSIGIISETGQHSAKASGEVTFDGGAEVTAKGFCWDLNPNPSLNQEHSFDGTGTGLFERVIFNLQPDTIYYVKAYAVNYKGTAFSNEISFHTLPIEIPVVATAAIINFDTYYAVCGGNVLSDGGASIMEKGVCWSTEPLPDLQDQYTAEGPGGGEFTSYITDLVPETIYYVRAYATNAIGTSYGNEVSFITQYPCNDTLFINHLTINGVAPVDKMTSYSTVNITEGEASKCWITTNLGADHVASYAQDDQEEPAGWYWQFNSIQGYKHDGESRTPNTAWHYSMSEYSNWQIQNDPCQIELGSGWRIPTITEWENIILANDWLSAFDIFDSELKIHEAGYLVDWDGSLANRGDYGIYWSSTQYNDEYSWYVLVADNGVVTDNYYPKARGFNVRCLHE